ncbi:thermonuclease family protein [Accumulibacter sp.]|uniref:thermonuclease family protein n=1 Tax=Accumulibacter sp. TaxID=2053492 RepID=UPI002587B1EC|nr:thermonuclease family protein [Accumulibacter sp.]
MRTLPCLLLALSSLIALPLQAAPLSGLVVAVADGDTLTLKTPDAQLIVRLAAIDAPEASPRGQTQAHSAQSRDGLVALALGRIARLEGEEVDGWGRRVGRVTVDGQDVGLALVTAGHAWVHPLYVRRLSAGTASRYRAAEQAARSARRGLWSASSPVAPWVWRRTHQ